MGWAGKVDLRTELVRPAALPDADVAAWRRLQAADAAYANPLLGPDFARAVGAVRDDAHVAVFRRGDEAVGFLAHHRRPGGFARPIGAPFCDYHALVSAADAGFEASEALSGAGVRALKLTALVDPHAVFAATPLARQQGYRIELETTAEAYLAGLWAGSGNRAKNHRRYRRALERAAGPLRLVGDDRDPRAFDTLIGWKRDQLARTGLHDFLAVPWAARLMRDLFETRTADLSGQLISLYAGDQLVAAHFGARAGVWFHPWIGAFDLELRQHSPGTVHQVEAIAAMDELGLRVYDLGAGEDHWKQQFTDKTVAVGTGLATAATFGGAIARSTDRVWALPPVGRVRNRLDQIAALELTLGGRLEGAAHALTSRWRRQQWAA